MLKQVVINMKALESMLFIWASLKDKEKLADEFYINLAASPEMAAAYDQDFDPNAFRRVLSAISNRELLSDASKKEKRFWNNNMWMMEDLGVTEMMLEPVKTMNLDSRLSELPDSIPYEKMEVIFYPGTTECSTLQGDKLFLNFFKITVNLFDPDAEPTIGELPVADFVLSELAKAAK